MRSSPLPALLLASILATGAHARGAPPTGHDALPLGSPALVQTSRTSAIAPGVVHTRIRRGRVGASQGWMLTSPVVASAAQVSEQTSCFAALGLQVAAGQFQIPGAGAPTYSVLRAGSFASRAAAQRVLQRAQKNGCTLHVRHSSEEAANAEGPWVIDVVTIDPATSKGNLVAAAGASAGHLRTPTRELAQASHALLAINGGFFVERDEDGYPGQPAGLSVLDGRLNSAPVSMRPSVLLTGERGQPLRIVRSMDWHAFLQWSNGARTVIDGVNRKIGLVRNCGRDAGEQPIHDHTCSYRDDVVYYPPGSIFSAAPTPAVRFAVAASGAVRQLDAGQFASGAEATLALMPGSPRIAELERLVGEHATAQFRAESSEPAVLNGKASAVNAGPTLLADGRDVREEAQEGWAMDALPGNAAHRLLMHDWINRRNPRTAIGIKEDGTLLLVTVDGHQHRSSVGLTIEELRKLMKALGARDAVNLDGGGSTALVIAGRLVNRPSDPGGERAVGDAIGFRISTQP